MEEASKAKNFFPKAKASAATRWRSGASGVVTQESPSSSTRTVVRVSESGRSWPRRWTTVVLPFVPVTPMVTSLDVG
jgi:hypothetical protein